MQDCNKIKENNKFSNENVSEYILFQMSGLENVLREFDYPNTLSCLDIIRSIFQLENNPNKRIH